MRRFFVFCAATALLAVPFGSLAQSLTDQVASRQHELQTTLDQIEQEIQKEQNVLDTARSQHQTLSGQIAELDAQIRKTQLQIQAINLTIAQLNTGIGNDNQTLSLLSAKLSSEQESLAEIMRQTQVLDDYPATVIALSAGSVSEFFRDLDAFASIQSAMSDSFDRIHETSAATQAEKDALEAKLQEQEQLQSEAQLAKTQVQNQQKQKQNLLAATKGVESNYQKLIASNKQTAAQIRAELFSLAGGGGQISLPTAITLAKKAGAQTGVDPAFILGILKQETNLGANVGQCLLTNTPAKGDGKGKNSGTLIRGVMKGSRDVDPFMALTDALGLDWQSMPVSCPQSSGYGGAMGPAQFIASTWKGYASRISSAAGHPGTMANPWDNQDAFTAIALYMKDLGAGAQTYSAERTAALKYFSGSNYKNPAFAFYGDSVMEYAADFQDQMDILSAS